MADSWIPRPERKGCNPRTAGGGDSLRSGGWPLTGTPRETFSLALDEALQCELRLVQLHILSSKRQLLSLEALLKLGNLAGLARRLESPRQQLGHSCRDRPAVRAGKGVDGTLRFGWYSCIQDL